jgi:hypothetical protein
MFFHIEERWAWLRTCTHTTVRDSDPDFARFQRETDGRLQRMLRIWLAEPRGARPHLKAYLGTVSCFAGGPPFQELRRLFRLASKAATEAGEPAGALRRRLAQTLRRYTRQPAGPASRVG